MLTYPAGILSLYYAKNTALNGNTFLYIKTILLSSSLCHTKVWPPSESTRIIAEKWHSIEKDFLPIFFENCLWFCLPETLFTRGVINEICRYNCPICGAAFSTNKDARKHIIDGECYVVTCIVSEGASKTIGRITRYCPERFVFLKDKDTNKRSYSPFTYWRTRENDDRLSPLIWCRFIHHLQTFSVSNSEQSLL